MKAPQLHSSTLMAAAQGSRRRRLHDDRVRVMFLRDFVQFQGGHLKVWHYFQHVLSSPRHTAMVSFTARSVRDATNPWTTVPHLMVGRGRPLRADVLFLAGLDWARVPARRNRPQPIVNLIQHVRHADPGDPRYRFLTRPALRICVAPEVADALKATGRVNGPIMVIPNGIDLAELPAAPPPAARPRDLLIVGRKAPEAAARLRARLAELRPERSVGLLVDPLPRAAFLEELASARVVVALPHEREGFFLPALEAMALGAVVVCPDCVGNRSFCQPGVTAFRPEHREAAIEAAALAALDLDEAGAERLRAGAAAMVAAHSLAEERRRFLTVLDSVTDYVHG